MTGLRLIWFFVKQYSSVSFFWTLTITSTLVMVATQKLLQLNGGQLTNELVWVRAGIVGMWTTCTTAAGIIGLERYRGTLPHLFVAKTNTMLLLGALVSAISIFGLLAFPCSWVVTSLLSGQLLYAPGNWLLFVLGLCWLWLAALVVTVVIALLFFMSPHALVYEPLLLTPMFLASGLLFTSRAEPGWLQLVGQLVPVRVPVSLLLGQTISLAQVLVAVAMLVLWLVAAALAGHKLLTLVRQTNTISVL